MSATTRGAAPHRHFGGAARRRPVTAIGGKELLDDADADAVL